MEWFGPTFCILVGMILGYALRLAVEGDKKNKKS